MALRTRTLLLAGAALSLAACGGATDDDRSAVERLSAASTIAPEEFDVLPQKAIVVPDNLNSLPPPIPGGRNRTDLTPNADAIVALSGQPGRGTTVASDNALLAATNAGAVQPNIRQVLAVEDVEYQRRNQPRLLYRWLGNTGESRVYDGQRLDSEAELLRWRSQGYLVPQMPPG